MEKNKCGNRNSPEVRDRAVWVVFEHQGEFDNQSAAIKSIAPKIGCGLIRVGRGFVAQTPNQLFLDIQNRFIFAIDILLSQTKVYLKFK